MTKVDERASVPHVGSRERGKLSRVLDRDHVVTGMLFGSQASGAVSPLSDVDIAVWLDPDLPRAQRSALRAELSLAAVEALGTDEIDVVVLNEAPPLLRHRALRDGTRLLDRDPRARVRLETAALLDYLDTAPLRQTLAAGRRRRIQEGRFGRR
ncbi:MAG TPA: nucleotidyltransferase domain-containing protein [Solirubrobacteraceae bacterium]|nr:nucleotidyltransferase domain-containing protein [Solirubrobacteraceae bacterium]